MQTHSASILVVGIGNLLAADDGVGVRVAEKLIERNRCMGACVMDGATDGLALLEPVRAARELIVIDAMDLGDVPPGTVERLEPREILKAQSQKLSVHGIDFADMLRIVQAEQGALPHLIIFGIQPESVIPYTYGITPRVEAVIDDVVEMVETEVHSLVQQGGKTS